MGVTVKELDLPLPPGDTFRTIGVMGEACEAAGQVNCRCDEVRNTSEFRDKVTAIFPNLTRYQVMGAI